MAVGRISVKTGSKGKASPHIDYILREDKYKPHANKVEELGKTYHGNMPQWAEKNPKLFWQEADTHERKNGSTYREHILTLPRELNEEQRIELVEEWIKNEIGDKHPYSYAIHNPIALDGKEQPHCHLMFCERELDGIERSPDQFFKRYNSKDPSKGGAKKANTGLDYTTRKQQLKDQRTRWQDTLNKHLERAGNRERVDLRNWKERGLEQKPVNISMIEMSKLKKSQQELKTAQFEIYKALGTSPAVEIIKQNRLAQERAEKVQAEQRRQEQLRQQEEAQHKAGLIKAQLEKMGDMSKGEVNLANYETLKTMSPYRLDNLKADHEQRAEKIAEKAQHELLTPQELNEYAFSKKVQTSIDRLQREREAELLRLEQERKAQEKNQKPPAEKIPLETHRERLELHKEEKAREVSPQPEKSLKSKIRRQNEPDQPGIDIEKANNIIKEYLAKVEEVAKNILNKQLKALLDNGKPLLTKLNNLVDHKPSFGKKALQQWELEVKTAKDKYDPIKTDYNNAKKQGVTVEHRTLAREQIAKDDPILHNQAKQASKDLEAHRAEQNRRKAQELGADIVAVANVRYQGKILRADEKGVIQQTKDGIVYHQNISHRDVKQGSSYTLSFDEKNSRVEPNFEFKAPTKDPSRNTEIKR